MPITYVDMNRVKAAKTSDTLIVLGSGSSINDLDDRFWEFCKTHDTLALNNWIYHWFVPTFWSIEIGGSQRQFDAWKYHVNIKGKTTYKDVIWIVATVPVDYTKKVVALLGYIDLDAQLYILEMLKVNRRHWLRQLDANDLLCDGKIIACGNMCNSLLRSLLLCYQLGYKTFILAGVDLYDSLYFWSDYGDTKVHKRFNDKNDNDDGVMTFEQASTRKHNSLQKRFHIVQMMVDLNNKIFKRNGVKLYVTNSKSALCPTFSCFDLDSYKEKINVN